MPSPRFKHSQGFDKKKFAFESILKKCHRPQTSELKKPFLTIFGHFYALKDMMINMENDQLDELYNPRIVVF